jgi:transcriptional regulator with XRE-family HTH domain
VLAMSNKKKKKYPEHAALKGRMRERKYNYRQMAQEAEISVTALSDKINGFYAFGADEMETIAEILEIAPKDIAQFFLPRYYETQQKSA